MLTTSQNGVRRGLALIVPIGLAGQANGGGSAQNRALVEISAASNDSILIPRTTTDAVTRVIFSSIRERQQNCASPSRLETLERMVGTVAGDPDVQHQVSRRLAREPQFHQLFATQPQPQNQILSSPESYERERRELQPQAAASPCERRRLFHHHGDEGASPVAANSSLCCQDAYSQRRNFSAAVNCSICFLPFRDAHVIDCGEGHVFCRDCVERIPSQKARTSGGLGFQSFFSWISSVFSPSSSSGGSWKKREKLCPECRQSFTTSIPVRKINDIVESVRHLIPQEFDAEDFVNIDYDSHSCKEGMPKVNPDAYDFQIPGWVFSIVTIVVIIAIAAARRSM